MKPSILYIAADYTGVHQSLHQSLSQRKEYGITIYIPLNYRLRNRNYPNSLQDGSRVICSSVIGRWDAFRYKYRVKKLVDYIISQDLDWKSISLIHATTWCVEGAIAYELSKRFSIPYIVAVRNTDVNTYFKYLFHHRTYFREILQKSKYVTFLSYAYRNRVLNYFKGSFKKSIELKSEVIFNGINSFFLSNRVKEVKQINSGVIHIIYVGAICRNKNLLNVIYAISLLREKGLSVDYTVVGKGKRGEESDYLKKIETEAYGHDWITILSESPKEQLIELYQQANIFAMCSFHETFGLVYAEALSQGLPILYSEGEGFDGVYPEGVVGFHANPNSAQDIADKLQLLIDNYTLISHRINELSLEQFDWEGIAARYITLYNKYKR